MYNTPVRFDGDIIITDPCYIMKKGTYNFEESPKWWDFLSKVTSYKKDGTTYYNYPKATDYPDCIDMPFLEFCKDYGESYIEKLKNGEPLPESFGMTTKFSPTLHSEDKKYREAEEKYREEHKEDWEICGCGANLEVLGFRTFLSDGTIYGDWGCTVYDDKGKKLGEFCADAGMVAVFLLDEVLKYNPDFDYHIERPWTTTLIKDFHGTVELQKIAGGDSFFGDSVEVVGVGNVNFVGKQTSL